MQKFKLTRMTAIYEGGKYTLKADEGCQLRNRTTGELKAEVTTKDYTLWEAIEGEAPAKTPKKGKGKKQ